MEAPSNGCFNAFLQGDLVEDVYMIPPPGLVSQRGVLPVYVDDLVITGSNPIMIEATKLMLQQHFKIKDLGEIKYFFGLEIARSKQGILASQRNFALDLISDLGLARSKPAGTPLEYLSDEFLPDPTIYEELVGKLLYLIMTRSDIAYAVQNLSQFTHKPKKSHMEGALRVVRYLKNAPGLRILLSTKVSSQLTVHYDADWAT
uniref:Uncharacterized mitochondrial protein AtMg00810-like n=1 Tax=Nicotiana tabacum TaxID=4097 RepID=A0A1S4CJT7_TOBAC|nr:PREDICTED: uncharacterized mitochondrial protein AtMg00810-like [Nicotiana tabacum]